MKKWLLLALPLLLTACGESTEGLDTSSAPPITSESTKDTSVDTSKVEPDISETENDDVLSFLAVGDNLIHSQIYIDSKTSDGTYDFKPLYTNVVDDIQAADLSFVNQESILGGDDLGFSSYPTFNTPSDMAGDLVELGFDLVSIANNHTLDKGTQGVKNTLDIWQAYADDILVTGAFDSQEDRDAIPTVEMKDVTLSFLAYTYGTNGIEPDVPYRLNYFNEDLVEDDVARAKDQSDFVVVSAHWGDEYAFEPNDYQKHYAQFLADQGVDVVLGMHSHTIQPIEWLTGKDGNKTLIVYSLGNFIASTPNDESLLGGMVTFDIVKPELTIENVQFDPLVIHYETDKPQELQSRHTFSVNKLAEYTQEQADVHGLNGYNDYSVSLDRFDQWVDQIIDAEFRKQ